MGKAVTVNPSTQRSLIRRECGMVFLSTSERAVATNYCPVRSESLCILDFPTTMFPRKNKRSRPRPGARLDGPAVPPTPDYSPTRKVVKPPGYPEIEAVSQLSIESENWVIFVRDVVQMPPMMTPAVYEAVQNSGWKISPNPMATVRKAAYQVAKRMGLR